MRGWLVPCLAALAACNQEGSAPQPEASEPDSAAATTAPTPVVPGQPALPSPTILAGEWRVAGIDGADFNEAYGLALSADAREIWWTPRCAGFVRTYAIEGGVIRLGAASSGPAAQPGTTPPPVCAIAPPARLPEVFRALDSADKIVRTPSNGIEISGGGHSVLLFSQ